MLIGAESAKIGKDCKSLMSKTFSIFFFIFVLFLHLRFFFNFNSKITLRFAIIYKHEIQRYFCGGFLVVLSRKTNNWEQRENTLEFTPGFEEIQQSDKK